MIHFYSADSPVPLRQRLVHRKWLTELAADRGYEIDSLSYIFCTDEYLLQMNNQFLQHDYYTDIITFPLGDTQFVVNAECYLSVDRIRDNAKANGTTFVSELRRVMAHGLLHLIGEDDKTPEADKAMRKAESIALEKWLFHVEQNNHAIK